MKLGAVGVNDSVILVSQWNAQRPACVFHFIHEATKSEGMSLEVTSRELVCHKFPLKPSALGFSLGSSPIPRTRKT